MLHTYALSNIRMHLFVIYAVTVDALFHTGNKKTVMRFRITV